MLFRLLTRYELGAPRAAVYEAVRRVKDWPLWWRGCERVLELDPGDADGVGARRRLQWRSRLPYRVEIEVVVTQLERERLIRAVSQGDLLGTGTWSFADAAGGTRIEYLWEVNTEKPWMRLMAPLLAPLFVRNHDWLMQAGAQGLAAHLGAAPPRRVETRNETRIRTR